MKIGIGGISGRIGQILENLILQEDSLSIQCGLVSEFSTYSSVNSSALISNQCHQSDIWIDFSTPDAFEKILKHCVEYNTPLVTGTTGLSKKHFIEMEHAANQIPVLWASNFAISINLIQHLLKTYSSINSSTVNITETHHKNKADKPSGTAITLARSIKPHGILKSLTHDEFILDDINIKSKREAEVAGIHRIDLENDSESFSIKHEAKSPIIFALGALDVAKWLLNQELGLYTMDQYIDSIS